MKTFLTASQIPIGSKWKAADGMDYWYIVQRVDVEREEAYCIDSIGELREIDTFKLQYRYYLDTNK